MITSNAQVSTTIANTKAKSKTNLKFFVMRIVGDGGCG